MRITRVYTKTGDGGSTRLVGGEKVTKDHPRIEAYGTVDELNAVLGIVRYQNLAHGGSEGDPIDKMLATIQNDLFNVGTDLATPPEKRWEGMFRVGDDDVEQLEQWIDVMNDELPSLKEFILPGGGAVGSYLHLGRTVCRRAERQVSTLIAAEEGIGLGSLRYLNRLSDHLFVLGRWAAKKHNESETYWRKPSLG